MWFDAQPAVVATAAARPAVFASPAASTVFLGVTADVLVLLVS
jgi:hypothetical protein